MRLSFLILFASFSLFAQTARMWVSSELYPEESIWFTNPPDTSEIEYKLTPLPLETGSLTNGSSTPVVFHVDASKFHQELLGIGTSLEETSVYAILKNKTDEQVKEILRALIDPQHGIGMNLFRITIGTSDFSDGRAVSDHPQGFYSYQDDQDDNFSIQNDIDLGILKVLKMAMQVAQECEPPQEIKFFASCWSPPPWMKTSNSLIGGTLKKGFEKELASYFRNFIEAYQKQGILIHAMTIQNEPNFVPDSYPGMKLDWRQERDVAVAVYEEFQKQPKIDTKLWIIDHNFEYWKKADNILTSLDNMGKNFYIDAAAFHDYSRAPASSMQKLKQRHPDINLQFSEMSKFGVSGMYDIQHYFWNGSQSYVYWVTMSTQTPDEHNQGPYNSIDMLSPTMLIQPDGDRADWIINSDYYLLGQFSKFIRPGAMRLDCNSGSPDALTAVAFENPDNSIAVVLVNQTDRDQAFQIDLDDQHYSGQAPATSVVTIVIQHK